VELPPSVARRSHTQGHRIIATRARHVRMPSSALQVGEVKKRITRAVAEAGQ
jgi:hypothetical protein